MLVAGCVDLLEILVKYKNKLEPADLHPDTVSCAIADLKRAVRDYLGKSQVVAQALANAKADGPTELERVLHQMHTSGSNVLKIKVDIDTKGKVKTVERTVKFERGDFSAATVHSDLAGFGENLIRQLKHRFPALETYKHFQRLFQPMTTPHEPHTQEAASVLLKFLGPAPVAREELLRQIRCFYDIKREQRQILNIADNSVEASRVLALRCLEVISKHHGGLVCGGGPIEEGGGKSMVAVARLLSLWWCAPVNSTACERVFAFGTLLSRKLSGEAAADDRLFMNYLTAKYFGPTMDVAELPGGLFDRVAKKLLGKERRHAVAKAKDLIRHGNTFRKRVRNVRSDKGKRGVRKQYNLKRRAAARQKLLTAPAVSGFVLGTASEELAQSDDAGDHPILHPPPDKPRKKRPVDGGRPAGLKPKVDDISSESTVILTRCDRMFSEDVWGF